MIKFYIIIHANEYINCNAITIQLQACNSGLDYGGLDDERSLGCNNPTLELTEITTQVSE
jgi:hypothetical protein